MDVLQWAMIFAMLLQGKELLSLFAGLMAKLTERFSDSSPEKIEDVRISR